MKKPTLKHQGYSITFHEVPNEVSLSISVAGCQNRCEGCHSPHLWRDEGINLTEDIRPLLDKYGDFITCVCLLGGDHNIDEIISISKIIRNDYGLKVCLYSGKDNLCDLGNVIKHLDYVKIGSWQYLKGGLDSTETNQRFYKINNEDNLVDYTYMFRNKKEDKWGKKNQKEIKL